MQNPHSKLRNHHMTTAFSGFGLVEIMVAMAIGMLTILVIMQALAGSEAQRRQSSGGSDANTAGALALQGIQRDIMASGAGMTGDSLAVFNTCYTNGVRTYNSTRTTPNITIPAASFAPISIWSWDAVPAHIAVAGGFDADTDVIQVISGGSNFFHGRGIDVLTFSDPVVFGHATLPDVTWDPVAGLHTGDLAITVESTSGSANQCVISQITGVFNQGGNVAGEAGCNTAPTATTTNAAQIYHSGGTTTFKSFYSGCSATAPVETAYWNDNTSPSLGVVFNKGKLYSLGRPERFVAKAYGIIGGRLMSCSPMYRDCTQADSWEVYGDGIVSMRAQFGYDLNNDQTIQTTEWTRSLPATPAWGQLKAVRLALAARGKQLERAAIAGADCAPIWSGYTATTDPTCASGSNVSQIYLASGNDGGNWNRYHVKVFETTVQTRNLFWNN